MYTTTPNNSDELDEFFENDIFDWSEPWTFAGDTCLGMECCSGLSTREIWSGFMKIFVASACRKISM